MEPLRISKEPPCGVVAAVESVEWTACNPDVAHDLGTVEPRQETKRAPATDGPQLQRCSVQRRAFGCAPEHRRHFVAAVPLVHSVLATVQIDDEGSGRSVETPACGIAASSRVVVAQAESEGNGRRRRRPDCAGPLTPRPKFHVAILPRPVLWRARFGESGATALREEASLRTRRRGNLLAVPSSRRHDAAEVDDVPVPLEQLRHDERSMVRICDDRTRPGVDLAVVAGPPSSTP